MKRIYSAAFIKSAALVAAGVITLGAWNSPAQDTTASNQPAAYQPAQVAPPPAPPPPADFMSAPTAAAPTAAAPTGSAPALAYGVSQILQLSQAKVGDDTIIAYIRNSGNSYGLNADQIIYLQQQGLSSAVLNAMLSQPQAGVVPGQAAVPLPSTPAPPVSDSQALYNSQPAQSSIVGPSVTGIDPSAAAAANYYYYQPYYYPSYGYPYYYPAYGYYRWYPGVSVSFGWRGGWGGGWRGGGWGGGWHGGGWHR